MELHPFDSQCLMTESHDLALGGLRLNFKTVAHVHPIDDQGMIARSLERIGQRPIDRFPVMFDLRSLSMHEAGCANDFPPEGHGQRLMSQADAEHRNASTECP